MTKLRPEQLKTIKAEMLKKSFKYRQSNGIDNYLNAAILEGIEMKGSNINPFVVGDDGERVYGYDQVGNETRVAVSIIEQILMDQDIEPAKDATEPEPKEPTLEPAKSEIVPKDQLYEIIPQYLTDELIKNHPGTTAALISMQKTAEINIKERKGPKGVMLRYVDTAYMTTALNWATLMDWDFEVVETREDTIDKKRHISVLGCLTVHTTDGKIIVKQQWGSQVLKVGMEMGDALKAAASDSMKKCASMLGIAADVYAGAV